MIVRTPSEGSTNSGSITPVNPKTPELHEVPLPPIPIPEIPEIPGIAEFNCRTEALRQRVEAFNGQIRERPLTPKARVDSILNRVRAGINLDKLAF